MFKLIWSAVVGGGPMEWAAIALGVVVALGGAFGAGYAVASNGAIKTIATVATTAATTSAKAQETHDIKEHNASSTKSASVKTEDQKHDAKSLPIYEAISKASVPLPDAPKNSCEVSVDVIKDLNAAGTY